MAFGDLVLVCIMLQLVSLLAGWAPLFVLSPSRRRLLSTLGVGVLVGTAFVVVIPSGIHSMYMPPRGLAHAHAHREIQTQIPSPPDSTQAAPTTVVSDAAGDGLVLGPSSQTWEDNLANVVSPLLPRNDDSHDWQGSLNKFKKIEQKKSGPGAETTRGNGAASHTHGRRLLVTGDAHDHSGHDHSGHDHSGHGHSRGAKDGVQSSSTLPLSPSRVVDVDVGIAAHSVEVARRHEQSYREAEAVSAGPAPLIACYDDEHASKHMGAMLALGFVAMLLVDRFAGRSASADEGQAPASSSADEESAVPQQPTASKNSGGVELMSRTKSSTVASPNVMTGGGGGNGSGAGAGSSTAGSLTGGTPRLGSKIPAHASPTTGGTGSASFPAPAHSAVPVSSGSLGAAPSHRRGLASDANLLLGVLVYALVDGVTLGAQAMGAAGAAGWVVLPALVLHRAPVAFGVACFLMYKGRPAASVRRLVLFYAPVTPLVALLTYASLGGTDVLGGGGSWGYGGLGLATLFAGGAFLFTIAVHILPEIQAQNGGGHSHGPSAAESAEVAHGHGGPAVSSAAAGGSAAANGSPRSSSPHPRSHEDHSALGGGAATGSGGDDKMSWRLVWALNLGLVLPLMASWLLPREELFF